MVELMDKLPAHSTDSNMGIVMKLGNVSQV